MWTKYHHLVDVIVDSECKMITTHGVLLGVEQAKASANGVRRISLTVLI